MDHVLASAAVDRVVARARTDEVVAAAAVDRVVARAGRDGLAVPVADDHEAGLGAGEINADSRPQQEALDRGSLADDGLVKPAAAHIHGRDEVDSALRVQPDRDRLGVEEAGGGIGRQIPGVEAAAAIHHRVCLIPGPDEGIVAFAGERIVAGHK